MRVYRLRRPRARVMLGAFSLMTTLLSACAGDTSTSSVTPLPAVAARLTISPDLLSLPRGSTAQFRATVLDFNGRALAAPTVSWSTSNARSAVVSQTGEVSAVSLGTAAITASSSGVVGSAQLNVLQPPSTSLLIRRSDGGYARAKRRGLSYAKRRFAYDSLCGKQISNFDQQRIFSRSISEPIQREIFDLCHPRSHSSVERQLHFI